MLELRSNRCVRSAAGVCRTMHVITYTMYTASVFFECRHLDKSFKTRNITAVRVASTRKQLCANKVNSSSSNSNNSKAERVVKGKSGWPVVRRRRELHVRTEHCLGAVWHIP
jgi:hypothetical protein